MTVQAEFNEIECNICGSKNHSVVYKTYSGDIAAIDKPYKITGNEISRPSRIVKCLRCGLVFMNPRPAAHALMDNYKDFIDNLYTEEECGRRISARKILKVLTGMKTRRGKLLDIGCATGYLLDEARKAGWRVYGVELSKWAVSYAKEKLNLKDVFNGALEDAGYPENYFDAVVMQDCIEHLLDPKSALTQIRKVLKPDGILVVNTPDINSLASRLLKARWWGINSAHLYYFDRSSLKGLLSLCGFKPVKCRYHARTFSIKYWTSKARSYSPGLYRLIMFLIDKKIMINQMLTVNLGDQIEVYAAKSRKLEYLQELEKPYLYEKPKEKMKTIVVLPAYNAVKTLKITVSDIPKDIVDEIILVDDASRDSTAREAKALGLIVYKHKHNKGYGGNQKTCYQKALSKGADIIVMVHPDYQYDPKMIPDLIKPIQDGRADAVLGSRMMRGGALSGGMPGWKHNANILLTALENVVFGTFLTEYHSGFRAYSGRLLKQIKFDLNSNGFIFDSEIIAQILMHNFSIEEIPIRTRYFDEASKIRLWPSVLYGLGILKTLLKYCLHTQTFIKFRQFM
jgi:SAM-dependent methyltransferase